MRPDARLQAEYEYYVGLADIMSFFAVAALVVGLVLFAVGAFLSNRRAMDGGVQEGMYGTGPYRGPVTRAESVTKSTSDRSFPGFRFRFDKRPRIFLTVAGAVQVVEGLFLIVTQTGAAVPLLFPFVEQGGNVFAGMRLPSVFGTESDLQSTGVVAVMVGAAMVVVGLKCVTGARWSRKALLFAQGFLLYEILDWTVQGNVLVDTDRGFVVGSNKPVISAVVYGLTFLLALLGPTDASPSTNREG